MSKSTPQEAFTLEALVELHDEPFVRSAYEAVLRRPPDPDGLNNYLTQVRAGVLKSHILAELAESPEGKIKAVEIPGLHDAIARYRKRSPTLLSRLLLTLCRPAMEPAERRFRSIDNRLYLIEESLSRLSKHLDASGHHFAGDDNGIDTALSRMSPRVGEIFSELKAAIAKKHIE